MQNSIQPLCGLSHSGIISHFTHDEQSTIHTYINLLNFLLQWVSSEDGESCSNSIKVDEPSNVPQDNWLITQHIEKSIAQKSDLYPTVIYVNLTYKIDSSCAVCQDNFQLLLHHTDIPLSDVRNQTSNFILVANLTHTDNLLAPKLVTKTFVINPDQDGFYLALRDYGNTT